MKPFKHINACSVDDAVSLLRQFKAKAALIAGGTDLLVDRPSDVQCLVDINMLPLDYIEGDDDTGLRIGALTRIHTIETCPLFEEERFRAFRALAEAASSIGYRSTRNMATIGGNICNAVPSADLPPVLIALDADAKVEGPGGARTVPLEGFHMFCREICHLRKSNHLAGNLLRGS